MRSKHETELVRHRMYVAEVDVELVYMDDAMRLDEAWDAMRRGDLNGVSQYGQVYVLPPVTSPLFLKAFFGFTPIYGFTHSKYSVKVSSKSCFSLSARGKALADGNSL